MKKVFVLRTESLLASKNPTLRFGDDNTIVIPMAILQNLYRYNGVPEKKSLASQLIEYIDNIPQKDLLSEKGFEQSNGSRLRVVDNGPISAEIANLADFSRLDHRVYQVCKDLMANNEKVILISKNPNIRLKGNQLGITTELFKDEIFPKPCDQYTGKAEIFIQGEALDRLFTDENAGCDKSSPVSRIATALFLPVKPKSPTISPPIADTPPLEYVSIGSGKE